MVYRCSISHSNLGGMYLLWKYTSQTKDYFCLLNCGNFYLFFMLGVFTTKYRLLEKEKNANWLFSVCIRALCRLVLRRDAYSCFGQLE